MPRSFNMRNVSVKDPRVIARLVVGGLLLANLVTALIAFHPWGGSAEDLARESRELRTQVAQLQARLARSKALASKVEHARKQADDFTARYVTERRTTFSVMIEELNKAAADAGIKPKEASIVLEPVEGSDTLSQMTISAGYEGTYANLTKFVNLLDKSPRFLIIESMVAAPQQSGQNLNVSVKLDAFVREAPGGVS